MKKIISLLCIIAIFATTFGTSVSAASTPVEITDIYITVNSSEISVSSAKEGSKNVSYTTDNSRAVTTSQKGSTYYITINSSSETLVYIPQKEYNSITIEANSSVVKMWTRNNDTILLNKSSEVEFILPAKFTKKLTMDCSSGDTVVYMTKETKNDYSLTINDFKSSEIIGMSGTTKANSSYKVGDGTVKFTITSLSSDFTFKTYKPKS